MVHGQFGDGKVIVVVAPSIVRIGSQMRPLVEMLNSVLRN